MVQGTVGGMGTIHSTSRDDQSSPNDLLLVRQEVEKLFAMDSHNHRLKTHGFKGHQNSNRWSILRFLESVNREAIHSDEKLNVTAASSCSSSPNLPKFPRLGQDRRNLEDSTENVTNVTAQTLQYSQSGLHELKKSQRIDLSDNVALEKESRLATVAGSNSLPIDHSTGSISIATPKGRSRPIPVSRRRVSPTNMMSNDESHVDDTAEENHLKQIYDLRTWEMYIRISEARKKAAKSKILFDNRSRCITNTAATTTTAYHGSAAVQIPHVGSTLPPVGQNFNMVNTHMIPFLPKEDATGENPTVLPSLSSEHEMMFGDLDD